MVRQETRLDDIEFTYYGDLLGVANLYSVDKDIAYEKMNDFYNSVWFIFKDICQQLKKPDLSIFLFSDSIFLTGRKLKTAVLHLGKLYYNLFVKKIFLRGAMVEGRLDFDPRLELENITKQLPRGDVLFRVVTLEKTAKGARFLLERSLAKRILPQTWLTDELYEMNICKPRLSRWDLRRRIVLHREWRCYEYLWMWPCSPPDEIFEGPGGIWEHLDTLLFPKQILTGLASRMPKSVSCHYRETKELFDITNHRARITISAMKKPGEKRNP